MFDEYELAALEIQKLERELNKNEGYIDSEGVFALRAEQIRQEISAFQAIIDKHQELIDKKKEIEAEDAAWKKTVFDSKSAWEQSLNRITEKYKETDKAKKESIQNEIEDFTNIKNQTRWVLTTKTDERTGQTASLWDQIGLDQEEIDKIDEIIKMLIESLNKGGKKVGAELELWKKILMDNTGFTLPQMEKMWEPLVKAGAEDGFSVPVIEQFKEVMDMRREQAFELSDEIAKIDEDSAAKKSDIFRQEYETYRKFAEDMKTVTIDEYGNKITVWNNTEQAYIRMLDNMKQALAEWKEAQEDENFTNEFNNIFDDAIDAGKTPGEKRRAALGRKSGELRGNYLFNLQNEANTQEILGELERRKELAGLWGDARREKELYYEGFDEQQAKSIIQLEKEVQAIEALRDAFQELKEAGIQLAASNLVDFAHDLGKAFQDGAISGNEFEDSIRNMLRSLIDAMPQLLLNVGLQLISKGQWAAGLAFIAASGLMSFVSGMIDNSDSKKNNDEYEKLRRIQEQISDLLEEQKKQEEYYYLKRRSIDASAARNVNDMIITPQGNFSTHPDDYIIATKNPASLGTGNSGNVYVTVINNSQSQVSTREETNEDGSKQILVMVDQIVQDGLASGKYDRAMGAYNQRQRGRSVTS